MRSVFGQKVMKGIPVAQGGVTIVKTLKNLVTQLLFLGHMRQEVPALFINTFTVVAALGVGAWLIARVFDLNIAPLVERARSGGVREIVLATSATVDGQTTAHYITDLLHGANVTVTRLAHGVPVGGELDYLDEGTLSAAIRSPHAAAARIDRLPNFSENT